MFQKVTAMHSNAPVRVGPVQRSPPIGSAPAAAATTQPLLPSMPHCPRLHAQPAQQCAFP